jgi:Sulfotransferase domain
MQKVFVLSLFRTGTQSIQHFLEQLGYKTAHWAGSYIDQDSIQHLSEEEIMPLLYAIENQFDAFCDTPYSVMYEHFDKTYPGSKFILIVRDTKDWIKSVRRLFKTFPSPEFGAYDKIVFWKYFQNKPIHVDELSDDDLEYMYLQHAYDAIKYFGGREDLLVCHLSDEDKEKRIIDFLDIKDQNLVNIKMDYIDFIKQVK